MLKKLRVKFVIINMTIVVVMLGAIFALLYSSVSRGLERESMRMMESINPGAGFMRPPDAGPWELRMPYFSVRLDADGRIIETGGQADELYSDEAEELATLALAGEEMSGILKEYELRYLRRFSPEGEFIIFADSSGETAVLKSFVRSSLMVGVLAALVFLVISVLLARWAVNPVDRAWQQQRRFVADASHELKTPLTVISANAELLQSADADKAQLSESILAKARSMRELVESLLDIARSDAGVKTEDHLRLDFSALVNDAVLPFEPVFFENGLTFSEETEPGIFVTGSPKRLTQLVNILLDNAAKYTKPEGSVRVSLSSSGRNECILAVESEGEELSREEREKVFERFYRADKSRGEESGFGLGLSIARAISVEHGAEIRADSRDGKNIFSYKMKTS